MKINKNHLLRGMFATCSLVLLVSVAKSEDKPRVSSQLSAYKVVKTGEGESLAATNTLKPGEVLEYQLRYANQSAKVMKNVRVTLPIPSGLEYMSTSVKPEEATASTDGRTFAAMPLRRMMKNENGVMQMTAIPTSEYRYLRWSVATLPAGANATVSARVRLVDQKTTSQVAPATTTTNTTR